MDASSDLLVRLATSGDLDDLLGLYDETRTSPPTDQERETWQTMLTTDGLGVYCAQTDQQIIGTATLLVMPNLTYGCEPTAFIKAVVVREQVRRRGVATAMMHRVLADARASGCNKVQLLSHKRHVNDGAHDLYGKLGFEAEAEGFRLYLTEVPGKVMAARNDE